MRLANRVAVVTGAGSGIGRAIAQAFAAEGCAVVCQDLNGAGAEETAKSLPGSGHWSAQGDVTNGDRIAEIFREVGERSGRLDVLVSNAGVDHLPNDGRAEAAQRREPMILHMQASAFAKMLDIHVEGAFHCAQGAAKLMLPRRAGSMIFTSSIAGLAGLGVLHYSAAKSALLGFSRALARELGAAGIRSNCICPGVIETPMMASVPDALIAPMVASTPLRRTGKASEIASTALFLASDESSFVTGQWISPNGGIVMM
jgi:3-oxoacyl-[acyl-carrier protein] reductase